MPPKTTSPKRSATVSDGRLLTDNTLSDTVAAAWAQIARAPAGTYQAITAREKKAAREALADLEREAADFVKTRAAFRSACGQLRAKGEVVSRALEELGASWAISRPVWDSIASVTLGDPRDVRADQQLPVEVREWIDRALGGADLDK